MNRYAAFFLLCVLLPVAAHAEGVKKWKIIPDGSSVTFKGKQMGSAFEGSFKTFNADISFDEADLAHASVDASVDIASFSSNDKERDTNATGKEWFDAAKFPVARFVSTSFTKAPEKKDLMDVYIAEGTLTIKDVSLPASIPFTMSYAKEGPATMLGNLEVDRSKFGVGTGDWKDPSIIANDIAIQITLSVTPVQ